MTDSEYNENAEFIIEFVKECREILTDLEVNIITLGDMADSEEIDEELINSIFRAFHSIKGGAGFLNLKNIQNVAHGAENLLDQIRAGNIALRSEFIDKFVAAGDFIRDSLDHIEEHLSDDVFDDEAGDLTAVFNSYLGKNGDETGEDTTNDAVEELTEPAPEPSSEQGSPDTETTTEKSAKDADAAEKEFEITPAMVHQFTSESHDLTRSIENDLIIWAEDHDSDDIKQELFRKVHTLKGNCGFFSFIDLETLTHRIESLLNASLQGMSVNIDQVIKVLLQMTDIMTQTIDNIETYGDASVEHLDLYAELITDMLPRGYDASDISDGRIRLGDILTEHGIVSEEDITEALKSQQRPLGEILIEQGKAKQKDIDNTLKQQKKNRPKPTLKRKTKRRTTLKKRAKKQDIRVDVSKLDTIINLVGELVISSNMVVHNPELEGLQLDSFTKASIQMGKIVRELQETAMTIRMIPVAGLFKRMIRLVHDLSSKSDKQIDFRMTGEETEIDKTVVELITDPLVHIIRNSIDHGIESPEDRVAAGKPEEGILKLTAKHEEGEIWIIIEDDGQGIDRDKVLNKAIEKGLVSDKENLSDKEIYKLIFNPGFSTADTITDVSGRGVGMDVVKKNLEKIKGKIDLDSTSGKGTKVLLRIPLTLAILEGMRIRVGTSEYIVPLLTIKQFNKVSPSQITMSPDGIETVKIRDTLMPVIRLYELHDIEPDNRDIEDGVVLIIESEKKTIALFVDEIIGQLQTVIKGLPDNINKVQGVSGCTILGNGDICLILDIDSLLHHME